MMDLPQNMSGLMRPPAQPQAAPGAMQAAGAMTDDQATPEEQAAYEKFVSLGMRALFDRKGLARVLDAMDTRDPREGVATVTSTIVLRVAQAAAKAGQPVASDVILFATGEIFENVADLATESGIHDFTNDPKAVEGALVRVMDEVRVGLQSMGLIDQKQAAAEMQELQQADQSGQLAQMLPQQGAAAQPAPGRV